MVEGSTVCPDCRRSGLERTPLSTHYLRCIYCDELKALERIEAFARWMRLSRAAQVEVALSSDREAAKREFCVSDEALAELLKEGAELEALTVIGTVNATPDKAVFDRQGSAISFSDALSELVDNSIDAGDRNGIKRVIVRLMVQDGERRVIYNDNAGGMEFGDVQKLLTFASHSERVDSIGHYGVGGKAAIGHFSKNFAVETRHIRASSGYAVHLDAEWFDSKNTDWRFDVRAFGGLKAGETRLIFRDCKDAYESKLPEATSELSRKYGRYLGSNRLEIWLNGKSVPGALQIQFVNGNGAQYALTFPVEIEKTRVAVHLSFWIMKERSSDNSGVFFYLRDRFICRESWDYFDLRVPGRSGTRHEVRSYFRCEIAFDGPVWLLPINAYKNGIGGRLDALQAVSDLWPSVIRPYFSRLVTLWSKGGEIADEMRAKAIGESLAVVLTNDYRSGETEIAAASRPKPPPAFPAQPKTQRETKSLDYDKASTGIATSSRAREEFSAGGAESRGDSGPIVSNGRGSATAAQVSVITLSVASGLRGGEGAIEPLIRLIRSAVTAQGYKILAIEHR